MATYEGETRQSRYSELVNRQIFRTASVAALIKPPRPLTDEEITASLVPNFEYYVGIQQQRVNRFAVQPEILTVEQKRTHFADVFASISGAINRRFVEEAEPAVVELAPEGFVADVPVEEFELAKVIPLFRSNIPAEIPEQTGPIQVAVNAG